MNKDETLKQLALLRERLPINANDLQSACESQCELFLMIASLCAEARNEEKLAKHKYEVLQNRISLDYRSGKIDVPNIKMTESAIISLTITNDEVEAAKQKYLEAANITAICDAIYLAYEQRRSMISNEVSLYTASYFSTGDIQSKTDLISNKEKEITNDIINRRKQAIR